MTPSPRPQLKADERLVLGLDEIAGIPAAAGHHSHLKLLGGFELRVNRRRVPVSTSGQRLLAMLALRNRTLSRTKIASVLWPDKTPGRAAANLRATLSRLVPECAATVEISRNDLQLAPHVRVDVSHAATLARRLLNPDVALTKTELGDAVCRNLSDDLLPEWDEEWLDSEREHFRQLRLRALESLSRHLLATGQVGLAAEAAISAVHTDPLRESSREVLINVYLSEGNHSTALREYNAYRGLLHRELRIEPSRRLSELLRKDTGILRPTRVARPAGNGGRYVGSRGRTRVLTGDSTQSRVRGSSGHGR